MFKKAALAMGMLAMIAVPSIVSARDHDDDYRSGRGYYSDRHRDHEWRERERHREHERHEWLERQYRERSRARRYYDNHYRYYGNQYYDGYSNNGYNGNGYYDNYGNWRPYR